MKKQVKYLFPILLIFLMISCSEKKGNYDYRDIQEAEIEIAEVTANDGQLLYDPSDRMKLSPSITRNGKDAAADYDYVWSIVLQSPPYINGEYPNPEKEIGTQREVDYILVDAPGAYFVMVKVTHKTTKAISELKFKVSIISPNGWIVLHEVSAGKGDLSMIRDADIIPGLSAENTGIYHNLYSNANNGMFFEDPKFMSWRADRNRFTQYRRIYIFSEEGYNALDEDSFIVADNNYANLFALEPVGLKPQVHYYESPLYGEVEALMNNGNVYCIRWANMGTTGVFYTPCTIGTKYATFHPTIAPIEKASNQNTSRGVLYNSVDFPDGAFVVIDVFGGYIYPTVDNGAFKPQKINETSATDLQLVYLDAVNNSETGAIFKDTKAANELWLYHADFRKNADPVIKDKHQMKDLPGISNAYHFLFGARGQVLYYVSGSTLYSWAFPTGTATPILTLAAGETVTSMKNYANSTNVDNNAKMIFVATDSPSGGKVYKIHVNEMTGALNVTNPVEEFTGFGKIVDMIIKE